MVGDPFSEVRSLNYSPMLELVQKSSGAISQSVASQKPDGVIGSPTQTNS